MPDHFRLIRRSSLLALIVVLPRSAAPQAHGQTAASNAPQTVLTTWFRHIEHDELDSLRPLLAPDFVFVSDGARVGADAFVAMVRNLGITHPHVSLSRVDTHQVDRVTYLVYDRTESFSAHGVVRTVPETGTMVLVRRGTRWLIAQWTTTSPPR